MKCIVWWFSKRSAKVHVYLIQGIIFLLMEEIICTGIQARQGRLENLSGWNMNNVKIRFHRKLCGQIRTRYCYVQCINFHRVHHSCLSTNRSEMTGTYARHLISINKCNGDVSAARQIKNFTTVAFAFC